MTRSSLLKHGIAIAMSLMAAWGAWGQSVPRPKPESNPKGWTLQQCVAFAIENNISIQQSAIQNQEREVQLSTIKNSRLPSLGASMGGNMNFGRGTGRDGVTRDQSSLSTSVGASTSVVVFNGLRIKHNTESARLNLLASLSQMEQISEQVSLTVTSYYLQVLYNAEMLGIAERQVEISRHLLDNNQLKLESGKISEASVVENRSQLARDEYNLVQQRNTLELSVLELKQLLNIESDVQFSVATPKTEEVLLTGLGEDENIDAIYAIAEPTRPSIAVKQYQLQSSKSGIRAAKAQFYPSISANAGYSNSYYNIYSDNASNRSLKEQFKNNGSEYIGLNMSIPIFNRNATRNNVRQSELTYNAQELSLIQEKQALRKEIEQAYYKARSAFFKYIASKEAAEAALKSFGYEQERINAGVSTLYDYDLSKSRLEKAESEMVQAKYEFIFSTKIIKYYIGEPLAFDY